MKWIKQHKVITAIVALLVIFGIAGASSNSKKTPENKTDTSNTASSQSQPAKPTAQTSSTPQLTAYEVLSESNQGTTNRVEVYTAEKDNTKLIQLNDYLFAKYKAGLTHLYIDYFDDKSAANNYFEKQTDDSISEAQKDELYTHYTASMTYNTSSGLKELVRQGDNQATLKTY